MRIIHLHFVYSVNFTPPPAAQMNGSHLVISRMICQNQKKLGQSSCEHTQLELLPDLRGT